MAYEFRLPDLGEGLTEGEIARWLVSVGQEIAEDDPLVEVQTDKATVEIPSPAAGVVSRILVEEGDVVPVGTLLVVIGARGSRAGRPSAHEHREPRATPLVRKIAQDLGVELGVGGRLGAGRADHRGGCACSGGRRVSGRGPPRAAAGCPPR